MEFALLGFAALFTLLFLGLPIAFGMGLVGFVGYSLLVGPAPATLRVGQIAFDTVLSYTLSVLPLFILMGNFINRAGLSQELYMAANAFVGHLRGGLAMATVVACGAFSAVCGSSLATAATMAKVAIPSMREYGYDNRLATGAVAAGGTLGILIPPSTILVIYGIITESDIGKLFAAGILPGILGVALYMGAIAFVTGLNPDLGRPGERATGAERLASLKGIWGVLVLFTIVMGGIYAGIFTPTEAAGVGATGAFLFALARGKLTIEIVRDVLIESATTTGMLLMVLVGALIFTDFINVSGAPKLIVEWIESLTIPPLAIIFCIVGMYIVLGCLLDGLAMMILTVPILFPIVTDLGFDVIWFGIIVVVVLEVGLITPPIGINVFVLRSVITDVSTSTVFKGIIPFFAVDIIRLAILILAPGFVLFLPSFMR
ncbi:MAG: TRAP transporter large permease [Rhodospirillales bacterium]|jgi:tripartite ATP-independent transporter DctM subunit|nr:C4-dicarboxylate ABC transporter permease [Rhodospirillaceae bacterium]MDP6428529.1 TRAP transporter large permease [Rhodospirillales bacterium]